MRLNRVFLLLLLLITAAGCTTSKLPKTLPIAKASDVPISTGPSLYLVNVNIDVSGTGTQAGTAQLSFDNTRSTTTLQTVCSGATDNTTTATRPCVCKFSWQEINSTSGTNIPVKRNIQTKVTAVQPYGVTCASPDKTVYTNEILDGTPLSITLAPAAGNNSVFTVNTITMTKSTSAVSGSFQDQQGHYFDNILRYTCYEQFKRGMSISSFLATATTDSGDIKFPLASRFCLTKADGTANAFECYGIDTIQNSSQAYYYNLYVRDSERGSINPGNARYICPKVQEYLPGASAALSNAWPLDTSFALSLDHTESFPIGVEAFTKVSNGTDPTSQGSRCFKTATGSSSSKDGLINSCLGFAAKPNKDGTCPSFFDKAQRERPTFRLRRYISLYPQVFNTNGAPMDQTQSTDTVYVLDRPVKGPSSSTTTKPFTMRGPKPCPFSFFDHSGVTGIPAPRANEYPKDILPGYVATNNSSWRGKNIDGIEFPNTDTRNSCSAALTVLNSDHTVLSIATVNAANPVYPHAYIRPIQPWAPHYVEDTEFLACAPKPDPEFRDPPLHFAKDPNTGNIAWCAEAYPTQNNNVPMIDVRPTVNSAVWGSVSPFTSHVVKNSTSTACTPTIPNLPSNYPAKLASGCPDNFGDSILQGVARHPNTFVVDLLKTDTTTEPLCADQTCDRTVVGSSSGTVDWPKFPLLADALWTEQALVSDSTYGCIVTYDAGGGKTGKFSPSQGCCGANVKLKSGFSASDPLSKNLGAHLEPGNPDTACMAPDY